jgi:hypothetical protein
MESKHTKGNWIINLPFPNDNKKFISNGESVICYMTNNPSSSLNNQDEMEANAEHICKCVNAHDELINVLKSYKNMVGNTGYSIAKEEAKYLFDIATQLLQKVTDNTPINEEK